MLPYKFHGSIPYFQKGSDPKLLIISGMHGDEFSSISLIEEYLIKNQTDLPDYFYLPEFSPSAVKNKTRNNSNKIDINRSFFGDSTEKEVIDNISLLKDRAFDLCLDFHEDTVFSKEYYLYDSGSMDVHDQEALRASILESGALPYAGIDDPNDPDLRYQVIAGYTSTPLETLDPKAGFFWSWSLENKIIKRIFDIECPTKADSELKKKLVAMSFTFLLKYS